MQINRVVSSAATEVSKRVGKAILNNKPDGQKLANGLKRVNNFLQGEAYNPGRGAYYTLISAFVVIPRLMQVREPDEFREVLTRDVTTILTILFAMKGLKAGMCTKAQKDSGIVLVKDTVGKNAGKMKRMLGYLNPEGGIYALDSKEILSRYSNIKNRDSFVDALKAMDKDGGHIGKAFSIENKPEGLFTKAKRFFTNKPKEGTPLYDAAKKIFGEGFEQKSNQELIDTVKSISSDDTAAADGLKELIGDKALVNRSADAMDELEQATGGILNSENNPLTFYARNVASNFEGLSLGLTAGFLGFGLPKFNELLTKKKHLNKPGINIERAAKPEVIGKPNSVLYSSIKKSKTASTFQRFV